MKKFSFPLQAVLTLRRMREEEALRAYAQSMQALSAREHEQGEAQEKREELLQWLNQPGGQRFSAVAHSACLNALGEAQQQLKQKEAEVQEARKQQSEKLTEFLKARHKAELLQRLREKQSLAHKEQAGKKAEAELEELVLARLGVEKTPDTPIKQETWING